MKEEWLDVVGYEGLYQVSNLGRVKRVNKKVLKNTKHHTGYMIVTLCRDGSQKTGLIHQLVAQSFLGYKPNKKTSVVDHIDSDKSNNMLSNLQILSGRDNASKGKFSKTKTSIYTGVSFHKLAKKWSVQTFASGKSISIGFFECEHTANLFYKRAIRDIDIGLPFVFGIGKRGLKKVYL